MEYKKTTAYWEQDLYKQLKLKAVMEEVDMKVLYNQAIREYLEKND